MSTDPTPDGAQPRPNTFPWHCDNCGQVNAAWAAECGRCDEGRDQPHKCARCDSTEDRVNGYCSVECENVADVERERDEALRQGAAANDRIRQLERQWDERSPTPEAYDAACAALRKREQERDEARDLACCLLSMYSFGEPNARDVREAWTSWRADDDPESEEMVAPLRELIKELLHTTPPHGAQGGEDEA
jgi:hypothetical protein